MKTKKLRGYVFIILGVSGCMATSSIQTYNTLNKAYKDNIAIVQKDLKELNNEYKQYEEKSEQEKKELNNIVDDLKKQLKDTTEDNTNLQKQINSMMKDVSFNPLDVTQLSGATEYHMMKALKGNGDNMLEYAHAFVQAEKEYGVNAYFIASIVAEESGWGGSPRASDGTNNITGHAVYSRASRGTTFDSKEACVLETARLIKEDYINPKGMWWNDGYSIAKINHYYSANDEWKHNVTSIAQSLVSKSNS